MTEKTTFRKGYQPPNYYILETYLSFDIRPGKTLVSSRLRIERASGETNPAALILDGQDVELISLSLDGVALASSEYRVHDEYLEILQMPLAGELAIETAIEPETNTSLEGLYKSSGMYCTQCEAQGFRKITYYQDRPDVQSRFTTTVEADAARYPVLLSNGNLVAEEMLDGGRHRVTWQDPFAKPSYLFALVAGDLALLEDEFTTRSGRHVALRIYSEPHNIDQCGYAMTALKRAMRWDEETFGREYDLDIFMIVAVEDFNMGAMENKGLNVFNTSCVLATPDTATDLAYQRVEAVVAHEYFHNWSGNRVTCRDWFQLSLKEGFTVFRDAEFSADMNSRGVKRIQDVNFLRSVQFAEDAGPMAHSIRPDSYIEISNFYTTTIYEKGSEVVRMLHTLLGAGGFRRGSDIYFARHDGAAATTDDFLLAMSEASNLDLDQFGRWYEQAGTPQLDVVADWDNGQSGTGTLTLTVSQSCPDTPGQSCKPPLHIPVALGLIGNDGRELVSSDLQYQCSAQCELRSESASLLLHVKESETSLAISGLAARPEVSFLRGFSAPVRVDFPREVASLAFLAAHDSDGFARWDALQTLLVLEIRRLQGPGNITLRPEVTDVFAQLLDRAMHADENSAAVMFMLAALLTLPDEEYLFEQIPDFDVDAVCAARESLRWQLAVVHQMEWQHVYESHVGLGAYAADAPSMARRALANVALGYLVAQQRGEKLQSLLLGHFANADNLTDRRAALAHLLESSFVDESVRQQTVDGFYQRWQGEALVVDLWFSLQAASCLCDVETMRQLEAHSAFDRRNPNKVRALYGAFAQRNHRNFHALDGSGYEFIAERVVQLNATNPPMAARLLTPLTRWQRYDAQRRQLMCAALERIAEAPDLSKDVFEVVSKSLSPAGFAPAD